MPSAKDDDVLQAIACMTAACSDLGLTTVVIGGIAVALVARERYTKDVDGLVIFDTDNINDLLSALDKHDLQPRHESMADFGRWNRFVSVEHRESKIVVDLAFGCTPLEEEVVARSGEFREGDAVFRLPTPEDLVIMKAIAHRPQDLVDIRTIAEVYPNLDRKRLRYWIEQYAELLEAPEMWRDVELLLDFPQRH